jgi:hypothetical protein
MNVAWEHEASICLRGAPVQAQRPWAVPRYKDHGEYNMPLSMPEVQ